MSDSLVQVTYKDKSYTVDASMTFEQFADSLELTPPAPFVLARADGRLTELPRKIKHSCQLELITSMDPIGYKVYTRTACFVLTKAVTDVVGSENIQKIVLDYTIGNGYYYRVLSDTVIDAALLQRIHDHMQDMIKRCLPITKKTLSLKDAVQLFEQEGMYDKCKLFKYRRASAVNIYTIEDFSDYNYGYMAPNNGCIRWFDLNLYKDGFVLVLPEENTPTLLEQFMPSEKLFDSLNQSTMWGDMMGISNVGELNDVITANGMNDLILVQEALQEKKIAEIAEKIISEPSKKVVLIAGPSSSGKTTFSHRLSIQLRAHGVMPHPIQVDDYFVNREDTPLGEDGNPNYECLGALDVDLFNEHMTTLISGGEIELPQFNFITGKREYKGKKLKIGDNDILVMEGIHCLNERMTYSIHKDSKFKIYISALTQLNVDEHNRIPTTDGRLIRRIVRDAATRGASAQRTIAMWNSVRRGEEENIFPYQEEADVMFNSALIYELSVLKQYAEPLLFNVPQNTPQYDEAKRLLKFLDYFLGVSSENIPQNSIIREFVGGSCFKV